MALGAVREQEGGRGLGFAWGATLMFAFRGSTASIETDAETEGAEASSRVVSMREGGDSPEKRCEGCEKRKTTTAVRKVRGWEEREGKGRLGVERG